MHDSLQKTIFSFSKVKLPKHRKKRLQGLIDYIKRLSKDGEEIHLNFICTHNSRRSHLAQIWAQTLAHHFDLPKVRCHSGGIEVTALFPKIAETLQSQGFIVTKMDESDNPRYQVTYATETNPILCFSKMYNDIANPKTNFAAIMTCNSADEGCPIVPGARARFAIMYDDPKIYDHTPLQTEKYRERSLEIGQEMWWVFKNVL